MMNRQRCREAATPRPCLEYPVVLLLALQPCTESLLLALGVLLWTA